MTSHPKRKRCGAIALIAMGIQEKFMGKGKFDQSLRLKIVIVTDVKAYIYLENF